MGIGNQNLFKKNFCHSQKFDSDGKLDKFEHCGI